MSSNGRSRGDAAVGVALVGVVDEPAGGAHPELLRLRVCSMLRAAGVQIARWLEGPVTPRSGGDGDPAAALRKTHRARPSGAAGAPQPRGPIHARRLGVSRAAPSTTATARATRARKRLTASAPCVNCTRRPGSTAGPRGDVARGRAGSRPSMVPIRFDTWFYLALAPAHPRRSPTARRPSTPAGSSPGGARELHAPARSSSSSRRSSSSSRWPTTRTPTRRSPTVAADRRADPAKGRRRGDERRVVLPGEPGY